MEAIFTTDYENILQKVDQVDPIQYEKTRNYINGAVTYLSPYLSRGVISTKQVLERMLKKGYQIQQIQTFVKELCWRDYFQRVGQHKDLNLANFYLQLLQPRSEMAFRGPRKQNSFDRTRIFYSISGK